MAKLEWYKDGKEFEPIVYPEDFAKVEKTERENPRKVGVIVEAHRDFLVDVLKRDGAKDFQTKLTVKQIQKAYFSIIDEVLDPREAGPLA